MMASFKFSQRETLRRITSIGLRALTLFARFALLYALAVFLAPSEVALYGLVLATISYGVLVVGLDFNVFSVRELIASSGVDRLRVVRSYGAFFICAQLVALPVSLLLFASDLLPWGVAGWFLVLLFSEHFSQELGRVLIADSRPLTASLVQFLRWGIWVVAVIAVMWFEPKARTLTVVLAGWSASSIFACVVGMASLGLKPRMLRGQIDWRWIRSGMKLAALFFVSTLCWRAISVIDRYWVEALGGAEVLASYVVYVGFANVITGFIDAAVFSFAYPRILETASRNDVTDFYRSMRKLGAHTVWLTLALAAVILVFAQPVLASIGRDEYVAHYPILICTVLGVVFFSLSMIPHFGLYAWRKDTQIIVSHVLCLPFFFVVAYALEAGLGFYAVPVAVASTFLFMLLFKQVCYVRLQRGLVNS